MNRKGELKKLIEEFIRKNPTMTAKEVHRQIGTGSYSFVANVKSRMKGDNPKPVALVNSTTVAKEQPQIIERHLRDLAELLSFLPKGDRIKAIDRLIASVGLNIKDWITVIPFPQKKLG